MDKLKKIIVLYHKGDLDGISSAAIINQVFEGLSPTLVGVEYGDEFDEIKVTENYDLVYLVDFTFQPFSRMIELNKQRKLIWIDHHPSSLDRIKENPSVIFNGVAGNGKHSAAYLVWQQFKLTEQVPYAIKQISLFDTWKHKDNQEVFDFYYGLETLCEMNPTSKIWKDLLYIPYKNEIETNRPEIKHIIESGKIINSYRSMRNDVYAKEHAFETKFENLNAIVINTGFATPKKFKNVYDKKQHDIMIAFSRKSNQHWKISLYTDKRKINCSLIAKKYGGGGHKNAAGFQVYGDKLPFKI